LPVVRIQSKRSLPVNPIGELWASRDLILLLARRDVRLRYQHAVVGIGWAVLQPLLTAAVLTIFQQIIGRGEGSRAQYALNVLAGMVPWTFLAHAMTLGSNSLLSYYGVICKVYFPRLVLPLAAVLVASTDLLVALPLIPALMIYLGAGPGPGVLLLPGIVLLLVLLAAGLAIWLAILNIQFRDVANALPFLTQLWFFLSPIAYNAELIPADWRMAAGLNPMVGILEGFRWALFGTAANPQLGWWIGCSAAISIALLASGVWVFLRNEETLADLL
jgi:lipopolysaccharide transport system permease protein